MIAELKIKSKYFNLSQNFNRKTFLFIYLRKLTSDGLSYRTLICPGLSENNL